MLKMSLHYANKDPFHAIMSLWPLKKLMKTLKKINNIGEKNRDEATNGCYVFN